MTAVLLTNPTPTGDPIQIGSPVTWKMPRHVLLASQFSITVHGHALDQNNYPFIRWLFAAPSCLSAAPPQDSPGLRSPAPPFTYKNRKDYGVHSRLTLSPSCTAAPAARAFSCRLTTHFEFFFSLHLVSFLPLLHKTSQE